MSDKLKDSMLGVAITKEGRIFEIETPEILYGEKIVAAIIDKDAFSNGDVDSLLAPALGIAEDDEEMNAIQIQGLDRTVWLVMKANRYQS